MNQKDRAIIKGKMDKLQAKYLEAWQKQPKNEGLKEMWSTIAEISTAFDNVCGRLDYFHQAALERDDKFFEIFEENRDLKLQIEQLKEARDKAVKDWEEDV
jgi:hypothetical protein